MTEKEIAQIFEQAGLAKIVRDLANDELMNAVQSAMIAIAEKTAVPEGLNEAAEKHVRGYHPAIQKMCMEEFIAGAEWLYRKTPSEQAVAYVTRTHSPDSVSDFQAAMNIATAKAFDAGAKWMAGREKLLKED